MQSSAAKNQLPLRKRYLTHIISSKLIPKNLALLVLTHILDCDSRHFQACPFCSVFERFVLKIKRAQLPVVLIWVVSK